MSDSMDFSLDMSTEDSMALDDSWLVREEEWNEEIQKQLIDITSPTYTAPATRGTFSTSSSSTSSSASSAGGVGGFSGGGVAYSSSQVTQSATFPAYIVDGWTPITGEGQRLFYDSAVFTQGLTHTIKGQYKDGVAPIIDGLGENRGIEVYYKTGNDRIDIELTFTNVLKAENFYVREHYAKGSAMSLFNGGTVIVSRFDTEGNPIPTLTFENNKTISTYGHASGGAIFMTGGSEISDLYVDFIGNEARLEYEAGIEYPSDVPRYARGGAIFIGKLDQSSDGYTPDASDITRIGTIEGTFDGNQAGHGGAIYVAPNGVIEEINGLFINNLAEGSVQPTQTTGGANAGAIRVWQGTIGQINADFEHNVAHSKDGSATGGAISLDGSVIDGGISGDFTGNIAFSNNNLAQGGAFVLKNQSGSKDIVFTDSNFIGNIAGAGESSTKTPQGGGFYIENSSDVYFVADNEDVLISENYTVTDASWDSVTNMIQETDASKRNYNAIYAVGSTVTLATTQNSDKTITVNDSIIGVANTTSGRSKLVIDDQSTNEYGIMLNGEIGVNEMIVESGGVALGSFTHADGTVTHGRFINKADLTVQARTSAEARSGEVRTDASYLANVGHVDLQGTITTYDTAENRRASVGSLVLTGGTLSSDINADGHKEGFIQIERPDSLYEGRTETIFSGATVNVDTINVNDTLHLQKSASVNVETLLFTGSTMYDVNDGGKQIIADATTSFDFDNIELNFETARAGDFFDLIVAEEGVTSLKLDTSFEAVVFAVGERALKENEFAVFFLDENGNEIKVADIDAALGDGSTLTGLRVRILTNEFIPEPSTVALSLIACIGMLMRRRRAIAC